MSRILVLTPTPSGGGRFIIDVPPQGVSNSVDSNDSGIVPTEDHISRERRQQAYVEKWAYSRSRDGLSGVTSETQSSFTLPETTFHAREGDDVEYWSRLHGYYTGTRFYEVGGLDEVEKGLRVDPAARDKFLRAEAVIQGLGFTEWAQQIAVGRVFEADMRRFSRHYDGIDGAIIGFAFAAQFDTVEEARDTELFDVVDERFSFNTERLLQLCF